MKTDTMRKLAVVVAILCSVTAQSFSSERVFLNGVWKSEAFRDINLYIHERMSLEDDNLNLISQYAETAPPMDRDLPKFSLAKLMTDLTSCSSAEAFCSLENLTRLRQIVDLSIAEKWRDWKIGVAHEFILSKMLGSYIEKQNCTVGLQAQWDELSPDSMLRKKYEKSLSRLDEFNDRFARTELRYESDEARRFNGALRLSRLLLDGDTRLIPVGENFRLGWYRIVLGNTCARLREEQVSKEVLQPLINYAAIEITSPSLSMLEWAARLATCETMLTIYVKKQQKV